MVKDFWNKLKKPIIILAPMADVTDTVFRQIVAGYGRSEGLTVNKPDVFFTEFVSCDGLCSEGKTKLLKILKFNKKIERPIVAQFFGSKPENFYKCAKLAQKLGFDGIDINMGCPDKKVEKQGAGAALIKTPELAQKIIAETKRGAGSAGRRIPVSVKTRLGFNKSEIETWIPALLKAKPDAIILHGRTRKEMSKVPANWDLIGRAAEIVKKSGQQTLIIGNGDVGSLTDAKRKAERYGLDGVMVGRGIFANPWFFNPSVNPADVKPKDKIVLLIKHLKLFDKTYGATKNFAIMKKFIKMYVSGWNGAKSLRNKLMTTKSAKETLNLLVDR
ncbi:MAG: tRNA-dihydrouridine synthase [Candidatus Yanofskybacteria bacterium GW2011_GWA2_41_22]|uniref:tRNA-dihydrouridine synthase n=5 Tax=Parcubacteria group TaxID=1794811 RepID=A0A1F8HVW8_9BACT|nr:MAG: tRNA-dihydrouridine synthase [Candidatus Yanofskybacteria bacterium GW2011_GWA2_41_22]KKS25013.1 MAG: tRNA-dihydrouridine synthase [Candidatus Jorgensenbacteria bacterium GW2011_GWF2_41_8]KKS27126.1 MAG: tRNA-dihydrouridine synthase [Candidatus Yanofskybacteria bacterium GW2011_GWC2_41_9]OGM99076.1 MAG: hypothetical protein A2736_02035 [Candidatus Yanofskybacteria bacterium RIFCSPHIGHO2_01_FULL_41_27]OGN09008.1 MAG: hypothetical protein A3C64_00210 [Candidatus Yanofskybacteria bacterium